MWEQRIKEGRPEYKNHGPAKQVKSVKEIKEEGKEEEVVLGLKRYTMQDFVPFSWMPMHVWNWIMLGPAHVLGLWGFYLWYLGVTTSPLPNLAFCKF
jgi:hypothetical protein